MIIYKYTDGEYQEVAEVAADGTVTGETPTAKGLRSDLEGEGIFASWLAEDGDMDTAFVKEGTELFSILDKRYNNGVYAAVVEDNDWVDAYQLENQTEKQESGAPVDCNREYVEDPSEAPEDAQVYDGESEDDTHFYCTNYHTIGDYSDDFNDRQANLRHDINEELNEEHQLQADEALVGRTFGETNSGDNLIVNNRDNTKSRVTVHSRIEEEFGEDTVVVQEAGNPEAKPEFLDKRDWNDKVEGSVIKAFPGETNRNQWEGYTPPREVYSNDHKESKETLFDFVGEDDIGGVNCKWTFVCGLDNGENVVYKPEPGNSHSKCMYSDVFFYELSTSVGDESSVPETAAADLKNGMGSAQLWMDDAETYRSYKKDMDVGEIQDFWENNTEAAASISLMDYVTGNDDRHHNNFMVQDGDIKGIDNGGHGVPPDEAEGWMMKEMLYHFEKAVDEGVHSNDLERDEGQEMLDNFLEQVQNIQSDILDEIEENKGAIMQIAKMTYGEDDELAERMRRLLADGEDGDMLLRELYEEHMSDIEENYSV